jgi:hypothetical protein
MHQKKRALLGVSSSRSSSVSRDVRSTVPSFIGSLFSSTRRELPCVYGFSTAETHIEKRLKRLLARIGETLKRLRWTSVGRWLLRTLGFSGLTHAGPETYPYSPWLLRVTPHFHSSGSDVVNKLRHHSSAEQPATLPPSSRSCSRSVAALSAGTAALRAYSTDVFASALQPRAIAARYRTVELRFLLPSRHAPSPRHRSSDFSFTPLRLGLRRVLFISNRLEGGEGAFAPCQPQRTVAGIPTFCAPADAMLASDGSKTSRSPSAAPATAGDVPPTTQ